MGELVKINGEVTKLGTCEDLYYCTYEQAKRVLPTAEHQPGNLPPMEYMEAKHGFRYRFPFPGEENVDVGMHKERDRGLMVTMDPGYLDDMDHTTLCFSTSSNGRFSYNVNYIVPCPIVVAQDKKAGKPTVKTSPLPEHHPVEIVQQKLMPDGALWVVCRCFYCRSKFRLPPAEGLALAAKLRTEHNDPKDGCYKFWHTVADRIEAGYARSCVTV